MQNSSWRGWFGAEVGLSIYIHRRGFTTSSSSSPPPPQLPLPRRVGASHRAGLHALRVRAPWEFAPTRWATPPYRGHKAKFAPCETPPGRVGLVLKLDSLYIYIGGVSPPPPPTATNHRCCLPRRAGARVGVRALAHLTRALHARKVRGRPTRSPARAGARSAPTRALYARFTRAPYAREHPHAREHPPRTPSEHSTRAPYAGTLPAHDLRAHPTRTTHARPEPESSRALSEFAPTRWASPPCRCPSPPCCGVYLHACGSAAACAGRSGLL